MAGAVLTKAEKVVQELYAPRYYSQERADRIVTFFNNLKFTKGDFAGQPFRLEKWQENKIIRPLFGTVWENGTRCFNTAYISTARKNGKTEIGGGIAAYMLTADGEKGGEVYSCAGDKEQAAMVYSATETMIGENPELRRVCKIIPSQKRIVHLPTKSVYRVLSADADLKHGFNPSCVIYDELHVAKNRRLWEALSTGQGARRESMLIALTTAGNDFNTICGEQYLHAKKILRGDVFDPTYFVFIAEAIERDENGNVIDDWKDEETWKKANPNYGVSVFPLKMKSEFMSAMANPANENSFKNFKLNMWTQSITRWIPKEIWENKNIDVVGEEALIGRDCIGGLDLADTTDIAAHVLVFPYFIETEVDNKKELALEKMLVKPKFWIPKENMEIRSDRDRVPYRMWEKSGLLTATEGNVIDYRVIEKYLKDIGTKYNVYDTGYDPYNATQIVQNLTEAGLKMTPVRQQMGGLTMATKQLEVWVREKKIHHYNNPVLDWMLSNVQIRRDSQGNIMACKKKSTNKIDGIAALIDAVDRLMRQLKPQKKIESVYAKRGMITF